MKQQTVTEIVEMVKDCLTGIDSECLAPTAADICDKKVTYLGDSVYAAGDDDDIVLRDADEVVEEIGAALHDCLDGNAIAARCELITGKSIVYLGDSLFQVDEAD